jgi:hypothetical protein
MAEIVGNSQLIRATQVASEADVRQSANGVRFATFGETGVAPVDLDHMLGAVPQSIAAALNRNTYFFVPLALREPDHTGSNRGLKSVSEQAMVAPAYTETLGDAAICHRNVELGAGKRGVFISTRLMGDRFALSFEFFINVAHALVDETGVPQAFRDLSWQQALEDVRGETSMDAWEARHLALGRQPQAAEPEQPKSRRDRSAPRTPVSTTLLAQAETPIKLDPKEQTIFFETAFADAVAVYLLSLAMDVDYSELREREYPLLAPAPLAARLKLIAELYPANTGYEFSVRYRRRA